MLTNQTQFLWWENLMNQKRLLVKKNKIWLWTAVNHFQPGILAWVLGTHSAITFRPLWALVGNWKCYFYITDGWPVYPMFIPDGDPIICKIYMTRVEGENTRLRHYLARLHRKTLCYSKSVEMLKHSIRLVIHYLKFWDVPVPYPSYDFNRPQTRQIGQPKHPLTAQTIPQFSNAHIKMLLLTSLPSQELRSAIAVSTDKCSVKNFPLLKRNYSLSHKDEVQ